MASTPPTSGCAVVTCQAIFPRARVSIALSVPHVAPPTGSSAVYRTAGAPAAAGISFTVYRVGRWRAATYTSPVRGS